MSTRQERIDTLKKDWAENPRWKGIERGYTAEEVVKLQGSIIQEQTLAKKGAARLWNSLHEQPFINALGALTGNQAVQQVKAGLQAIYLSGWQVAADANLSGQMYPDQSLYPANSVPAVVKRINQALQRADQIDHSEGREDGFDWFAPIVAGQWQVKVGGSVVDPTGSTNVDGLGKVEADYQYAFTPSVEYFFNDNFSTELLLAAPIKHDIKLDGEEKVKEKIKKKDSTRNKDEDISLKKKSS